VRACVRAQLAGRSSGAQQQRLTHRLALTDGRLAASLRRSTHAGLTYSVPSAADRKTPVQLLKNVNGFLQSAEMTALVRTRRARSSLLLRQLTSGAAHPTPAVTLPRADGSQRQRQDDAAGRAVRAQTGVLLCD
jgi:hypothetical protein